MTQYLPPNLLALFAPRDPIPFMQPAQKLPHEKKLPSYQGVSQFLSEFEDPKDTPPPTRVETRDERKERKRKERAEQVAYKLEQDLALWDPKSDPSTTSSAFKTLFVARVNYDTSESKLRREFEAYGPVKKIRTVHNQKTGMPKGYAFVEFEHEADMHTAYKHADGKKIDGRRVLVDIERGRTIDGWRPRRLGGGLGGTRRGGPDVNTKYSGRDDSYIRGEDRDQRSRSRERRRRRSRSRSRERERRRRSRSREREPRRRRSRSKERKKEVPEGEEDRKPRRRRSRSRERERHRRSRSRDRKRRRSKSPRERKPRSRSRERAMQQAAAEAGGEEQPPYPDDREFTEEGYPLLRPEEIKKEKGMEHYEEQIPPQEDGMEEEQQVQQPMQQPENGGGEGQYEYNEYGSYEQQ